MTREEKIDLIKKEHYSHSLLDMSEYTEELLDKIIDISNKLSEIRGLSKNINLLLTLLYSSYFTKTNEASLKDNYDTIFNEIENTLATFKKIKKSIYLSLPE